jgi:hypothetical protein
MSICRGTFQIVAKVLPLQKNINKHQKDMTKAEYLEIAASRYEELEALKAKDNFYDYEKTFDQI